MGSDQKVGTKIEVDKIAEEIFEAEFGKPAMICRNSNCGYKGNPKKIQRGRPAVCLVLCLLGILPGILYFALKHGFNYFCPKCGLQFRSDW